MWSPAPQKEARSKSKKKVQILKLAAVNILDLNATLQRIENQSSCEIWICQIHITKI